MALEYVLSEKNKYNTPYNGFLHVKERKHENKICWKYKKIHCNGGAHVVDDKVTKCIEVLNITITYRKLIEMILSFHYEFECYQH